MRLSTVNASKQQGLSLIEVLVAAIITAIGLLGLAGMQLRSLQMNQSAHYLSQANYYAYEIVDAMRLNPEKARQGDYDLSMGDNVPNGDSVVNQSLRRWVEAIEHTLPMSENSDETGARVQVSPDDDTDSYEIRVEVTWIDKRWEEQDDGEDGNNNDSEDSRIESVIMETNL